MSDQFLQRKFIFQLSNRLERFKQRGTNLFNFRCHYCGDSKTNPNKARGYLFEKKGSFQYYCQNCSTSRSFERFLRDFDLSLYEEFLFERMTNRTPDASSEDRTVPKSVLPQVDIFSGLKRISELGGEHQARQFIVKRRIPVPFQSQIYYTPTYKSFVNNLIPGKIGGPDNGRVIIPFLTKELRPIGFTGRAIDPNDKLRYSHIVLDKEMPCVYGLDRVNFNLPYYVLEGQFDSMFLQNAIAIGGSDLVGGLIRLGVNREHARIVFDNECRNSEILAKMNKAITNNYHVCIWPETFAPKDINDAILAGYTASEVMNIIDSHTNQGVAAKLAFAQWKRA